MMLLITLEEKMHKKVNSIINSGYFFNSSPISIYFCQFQFPVQFHEYVYSAVLVHQNLMSEDVRF